MSFIGKISYLSMLCVSFSYKNYPPYKKVFCQYENIRLSRVLTYILISNIAIKIFVNSYATCKKTQ